MFDVILDESNVVIQEGTSEGTQIKYFRDGFWYKLDKDGKEGLCEYLSSKLLTFSSLNFDEYIQYEQGIINGRPGCRSKNFLKSGEELITLSPL
ncbi:MAG: hypothetical protein K6B68_15260 [Eubacterium sp.]|nr:hypothetical protein [Eubacterium sp.]